MHDAMTGHKAHINLLEDEHLVDPNNPFGLDNLRDFYERHECWGDSPLFPLTGRGRFPHAILAELDAAEVKPGLILKNWMGGPMDSIPVVSQVDEDGLLHVCDVWSITVAEHAARRGHVEIVETRGDEALVEGIIDPASDPIVVVWYFKD